jgi:hypothetical protein
MSAITGRLSLRLKQLKALFHTLQIAIEHFIIRPDTGYGG